MTTLTGQRIAAAGLTGWACFYDSLETRIATPDFAAGLALVAAIGAAAEQAGHHPDVNLILATGGPGMVKAAYSSGKPAIGVGAGNTPVVIDECADIKRAVASILMSKTFDNGVVCASEQAVIVRQGASEAFR